MHVAITGSSGYVAERLISSLVKLDEVDRVLGFDVRPPRVRHQKFVFDEMDVRDAALAARLQGVDVLVHLAFVMDPIRDETKMRDINVNGSQNVFRCAGEAGVRKVVYTSSATVYGAHPDNDQPLTEESPLRANLDFSYPAHKLEVEYVVREFSDEFPQVKFVLFRPAIVFGPRVDNAWSHLLELPVIPAVQGYAPRMQFVHEDDVGDAVAWAVLSDVEGIFNLAPADHLSQEEILAAAGRRKVDLPEPLAFATAERLWDLRLGEAPAGMLHYVMHPWVLDPGKLSAAGFACRYSSAQALGATVTRTRDNLRLGKTRVNKRSAGRRLALGAGAVGGVFAVRAARGRRAGHPS